MCLGRSRRYPFGRYHDEVWGTARTTTPRWVAAMTERDVDRLVEDAIIRNRGKIQATVDNVRAMMSATPSLVELARSYEIDRKRALRSIADLPKVDSGGGGVREAAEVRGTAS